MNLAKKAFSRSRSEFRSEAQDLKIIPVSGQQTVRADSSGKILWKGTTAILNGWESGLGLRTALVLSLAEQPAEQTNRAQQTANKKKWERIIR
ncbi:MAG: hypothetical protein WCY54_02890 [Syntrophales bacterium]